MLNSQRPESVSFEWEVREWVVFMKPSKRVIGKIIHNYSVSILQNRAKMNAVFQWRQKRNWRNVEASLAKMFLTCFLNATVSEVSMQNWLSASTECVRTVFGVFCYHLSAPFSSVTSGVRVSGSLRGTFFFFFSLY